MGGMRVGANKDGWSDEDTNTLIHDWNKLGASSGDVAKKVFKTREAVCAKVMRLRDQGVEMTFRNAQRAGRFQKKKAAGQSRVAVPSSQPSPLASPQPSPQSGTKPALVRPAHVDIGAPIDCDAPPKSYVMKPVARGAVNAVLDLRPNQCRWPFGETNSADFCFCSGDKMPGSSYCTTHFGDSRQLTKRARREVDGAEDERRTQATPRQPELVT